MSLKKKLRYFLILYLIIFFAIGGAYSFYYGSVNKNKIEESSKNIDIHETVKEDSSFGLKIILSLILWILSMIGMILSLIAWIGLYFFWRIGPVLFSINLVFGYIIFPLFLGWWETISPLNAQLITPSTIAEPNLLFDLWNSISLILSGVILAIVFSKEGNALYKSNIKIQI